MDRVPPGVGDTDLVFVIGAPDADLRHVDEILFQLGLAAMSDVSGLDNGELTALNDSLLEGAGGSREALPSLSPQGFARLIPDNDETVGVVRRALELTSGSGRRVISWADPALSLLAIFWQEALGFQASTVFVHDRPRLASVPADPGAPDELEQWARYNRSALMGCFDDACFIVNGDRLSTSPEVEIKGLHEFLAERHGTIPREPLEEIVRRTEARLSTPDSWIDLRRSDATLANLLDNLDGPHRSTDGVTEFNRLVPVIETFYDDDYYGADYDKSGVPYSRSETLWRDRFASLAQGIVEILAPRSVLDVGCASGMLVEALRELGVEAAGVDASRAAIDQVPPSLRPYCTVGSVLDDFGSKYDLIVCSEVVEHLLPFVAEAAIANLCAHADTILFSSTPDDFAETTHLNVQRGDYWAKLFLNNGFTRDGFRDASFVAPHAVVFRRTGGEGAAALVENYEWAISTQSTSFARRLDAAMESGHAGGPLERREREAWLVRANRKAVDGLQKVRRDEIAYRRLADRLNYRTAQLEAAQAQFSELQNTKLFRYARHARRIYGRLRKVAIHSGEGVAQPAEWVFGPSYEQWIEEFERLEADELSQLEQQLAAIADPPLISLIMPVYDPPVAFLRDAIESALGQLYPHWQLCIADDCSPSEETMEVLQEYAAADERIRVVARTENGHISAASNSALALTDGDWIACLDHDDVIPPFALAIAAREIARHPGVGLLYSDDDKIDVEGARFGPYFKPDFDRLRLLGQNYVSHLCLYRRDLVDAVGGFRLGYEGSQDWDLALRVVERLDDDEVVHIPHVLYHWRSHEKSAASSIEVKPYAASAGLRAVQDHIARTNLPARAEGIASIGHNRVTWSVEDPKPHVTVVVVASGAQAARRCVSSITAGTDYSNFEVVVAADRRTSRELESGFDSSNVRIAAPRIRSQDNRARQVNDLVAELDDGQVCLVSDSCVVGDESWLEELLGHLGRPRVGVVGGKIRRPDGRIWSAGYAVGVESVAYPLCRNDDPTSTGYFGSLILARQVSAVSRDLMMINRQAWAEVGGFDALNVPAHFTDVDFCLRLSEAGWTTVWTPECEATALASDPPGNGKPDGIDAEIAYMQDRWFAVMVDDPFYNPNLTIAWGDLSLAWPPRVKLP